MALAGILAGAAQRYTVIDRAVIADFCRLTKDDAHAVVDKKLAADFGTGVDLDAGQMPRQLADKPGQKKAAVTVQKMGNLMRHQHMKARIQNDDLRDIARRRVLIADVFCVFPKPHNSFPLCFTILVY